MWGSTNNGLAGGVGGGVGGGMGRPQGGGMQGIPSNQQQGGSPTPSAVTAGMLNLGMGGGGGLMGSTVGGMPGGMVGIPSGATPPPSNAGSSGAGPASNICRFFLSGGCMRGDGCPYLHELPDERHLDVNNQGFIFNAQAVNSNVVNAGGSGGGGAGRGKMTPPSQKKAIPRYKPPETQLDHNVPPSLAYAFKASDTSGESAATTKTLMRLVNPSNQ